VTQPRSGEMARAAQLIVQIRVAFLITAEGPRLLHARPVETLGVDPDQTLWFFTGWSSPKVAELQQDFRVSLTYADPAQHAYVAVSGTAALLRDPARARKLWTVEQRAYYPQGPDDPGLALLRVRIEHCEYWLTPTRIGYLVAAAKAAVTGKAAAIVGENRKVE
jgi:general stress protein 26